MKIVMLCDLYDSSLRYQENLLAKYYIKHGHNVCVIAGPFNSVFDFVANRLPAAQELRESRDGGVRVLKLPYALNIFNRLRRFAGVPKILEREKPDLIFVHDIHLNLREVAAYKRSHPHCRVILDYHADFSNSAKHWASLVILHKMIRRTFLKRYRFAIDRIFPIVPTSADFLHEVYAIPTEEMELLPLGSDVDLIAEIRASGARDLVRSELGIASDDLLIFTGGKLAPIKETHLLLEAFQTLGHPKAHLVIIGSVGDKDACYLDRLKTIAASSKRIHFTGWLEGDDVFRHLLAADLAVFPASQSVLWQHAIATGLPLIVGAATAVGAQDPSYLNRHDNMVILPRERVTAAEIAKELQNMIQDRALLALRQEGARMVGSSFLNYNVIIQQTLIS